MDENKPGIPDALKTHPSDQLLDGILERAVNTARRNAEQFARLAALARAIEQCNSSPATRAKMLFSFEELTSSAEAEAKLDAEFFEGLRDGQTIKQQLRRQHEQRAEPVPEVMILAPSTTTKH
ncbi:hypothetical protein [Paraburkholderia sp. BCC1885]|uniref:hypothetical protein n=1 Tax=Paraburkholderia sp. BCC1885 TaxID=2562669 RepID=UPI0011820FB0|nr:hypothetical protein [Paraburkholderia sp. BCC1885]